MEDKDSGSTTVEIKAIDPRLHLVELVSVPGLDGSLKIWVCTHCKRGPFQIGIVVRGDLDSGNIEAVSSALNRKEANRLKASMNMVKNRAEYWVMPYEEYCQLMGIRTNVVEFEHNSIWCDSRL